MLINLISTNNYNQFNIELAHTIGLHESIYLNELINIYDKAIRKNKVSDGFFILDREYIKYRTTIHPDEQREIDKELKICNILEIGSEKDSIKIDLEKLTTMLMSGNESILKGFAKEIKNKKKETKADIIKQNLKKNINTTNDELYNAYCEWIESVSNKRGYMDKKAVIEGQKVIDDYCNRDLDKALKIISIATSNSYIDMTWAINNYKKDYAPLFNKAPVIQSVQQLSTEVF